MELKALEGFTVGITATRRWEDQAHLLTARGAAVLHGPVLDVDVVGADAALRDATAALIERPPDLTILCTGAGTKGWLAAAESFGAGEALLSTLGRSRVLPRGPKTVAAAIEAGLDVPRHSGIERLAQVLAAARDTVPLSGARVALQLDGGEQSWLIDALRQAGAEVVAVRVYRWTAPDDTAPGMRLLDAAVTQRLDAVTFTSAPAVDALFTLAARTRRTEQLQAAFAHAVAAVSVGPVTSAALRERGVRAPVEPRRARLGAMVWTVVEHLQARRRVLTLAGHTLFLQGAIALVDGEPVRLSDQERRLLAALAHRPGHVVPKAALQSADLDGRAGAHAIEMAMGRLRRKLGPAGMAIETVFRRGYRLDVAVEGTAPTAS